MLCSPRRLCATVRTEACPLAGEYRVRAQENTGKTITESGASQKSAPSPLRPAAAMKTEAIAYLSTAEQITHPEDCLRRTCCSAECTKGHLAVLLLIQIEAKSKKAQPLPTLKVDALSTV